AIGWFAASAGYSILFVLPVLSALVSHPPRRSPTGAFSVTRARGRPARGRPLIVVALHTRQTLRATRVFARAGALGTLIQSENLSRALQRLSRIHPGLITSRTLILTPEFSAGDLCHFPHAALPLGSFLARHPHTRILIGAVIPVRLTAGAASGCTDGAALFRGARLLSLVSASQPAPISEWNPLHSGPDYPAHWFRSALIRLPHGGSLAVLVCYEGTVPWFPLLAASDAPRALLSMDSDLWPHGRQAAAFEARIVRAWGRFYGIPVAIADAS
ncbi:conjugal transfer protein (TraB), partial [mine drainage metagenome]